MNHVTVNKTNAIAFIIDKQIYLILRICSCTFIFEFKHLNSFSFKSERTF